MASADNVILLRHDVDLSLEYACDMAKAEYETGVRSTYFILPFNDYYNPLSPAGRRQVRTLVDLGHEIGLHWDSSLYPNDPDELERSFRRDLALLEDLVDGPIVSASQHVPIDSPFIDVEKFIQYEAYSDEISSRFAYVSDSSLQWRQHTPLDLIGRGIDFQFLAHPVWWFAPGNTMREKIESLAPLASERMRRLGESLIAYIEKCLADRSAMDARYQSLREQKARR